MRKLILALTAASLVPAALTLPVGQVAAQRYYHQDGDGCRRNANRYHRRYYQPRIYRGRDGRSYCRHSDGTTGLIVGGVGGALLGNTIAGHGDKGLGTVLGGVAGAFGGRALDRASTADRRCR